MICVSITRSCFELSCGFELYLSKFEDKICQCGIVS